MHLLSHGNVGGNRANRASIVSTTGYVVPHPERKAREKFIRAIRRGSARWTTEGEESALSVEANKVCPDARKLEYEFNPVTRIGRWR